MTVMLDDAAKEGLVYTMRYLGLNHADAARWLLRNAQILEPPNEKPVGVTQFISTRGKRMRFRTLKITPTA